MLSPLDWGLGHATRCIPVGRELLSQGAELMLAAEGQSAELLREALPEARLLPLRGYRVTYSQNPNLFKIKLLAQVPRVLSAIRQEHQWLRSLCQSTRIDAIVSDNRYGLWHPQIPSVLITHQVNVQTGFRWMDEISAIINKRFTNRFNECWIPDTPGAPGLAGKLSRPIPGLTTPVKYIGPLSRFSAQVDSNDNPLLVLMSGPEPARSRFEEKVMQWLTHIAAKAIVVRGKPGIGYSSTLVNGLVTVYNHLSPADLQQLIARSRLVIARCGYSTVMDLAVMGKEAVLIPTPGQTEQLHLAGHLRDHGFFGIITEDELLNHDLAGLQRLAAKHRPPAVQSYLSDAVGQLMNKITG